MERLAWSAWHGAENLASVVAGALAALRELEAGRTCDNCPGWPWMLVWQDILVGRNGRWMTMVMVGIQW